MMKHKLVIAAIAGGFAFGLTGSVISAEKPEMNWGKYQVGDLRSGYTFAKKETRAIQDEDIENPGFLWVDKGEELWSMKDGEAGKSCMTCHNDASKSMSMVGATYPVIDKKSKKLMAVQQRINECRTQRMGAKKWKWESENMLGMSVYVNHQAKGKPMSVKVDGAAKPYFEKGRAFYNQRRGQLDMACANCHVDNAGKMIRANTLTQGMGNGFPTYRLKWGKVGSIHRRFVGCNKQVRAVPYKRGSEEYLSLELYVKSRARGLPVETPAVRN